MSRSIYKHQADNTEWDAKFSNQRDNEWQNNRGPRYGNLRKQMAKMKVVRRREDRARNENGLRQQLLED